jgi:site-specific DNA-methyltransferase (adenine-specific)
MGEDSLHHPQGAGDHQGNGERVDMRDVMFSSDSMEWETPQWLFDELDKEFHFDLDPCSTHENAKCKLHYTKEEDGLLQDWTGHRVFCNPPYGREIGKWVKKAYESKCLTVMLIPARTDTKWFHQYIYIYMLKSVSLKAVFTSVTQNITPHFQAWW